MGGVEVGESRRAVSVGRSGELAADEIQKQKKSEAAKKGRNSVKTKHESSAGILE